MSQMTIRIMPIILDGFVMVGVSFFFLLRRVG